MKKLRLLAIACSASLITVTFSRCSQSGKAETNANQANNIMLAHPLDPLDSTEIKLVKEILVQNKIFNKDHFFSFIKLNEPSKSEVLTFKPGQPFRREAIASIYHYKKNILSEVTLDLKNRKVLGIDTLDKMQPVGQFKADSVALNSTMLKSAEWISALEKRGISIDSVTHHGNDASDLSMGPIGHREKIIAAHYKNKKHSRLPVMGLYAFVDLTDNKVLKIIDQGQGFSEPIDINYFKEDSAVATTPDVKPLKITQPEGATFNIKGHEITWNNWKFRYGISNREGLIIYQASFKDNGKWRSVMYRGSMPEMVVNYGSPDILNASNNYFDVGTYRLAQNKARPMTPGVDAPENAVYLTTTLHDEEGKIKPFERAIAVYEEFDGPLWRHNTKGRPSTNLALKYFTTIGNYDYGFKWVFKQDGNIDVVTELNGIVHIRGVERVNDLPGAPDDNYKGNYYGTLVSEHVEAVNHQHFFVYRMDMDVDGTENSVAEMNTVSVLEKDLNPLKSTMVAQMTHLKSEKEAQRSNNVASARHWKIMNEQVQDKWGHHSSYMLMPSPGVKPFAMEGSSLMNRAGFLKNHFWVTPLNEKEIYPAGEYPESKLKNAGLPTWAADNQNLESKDLVMWYVAGVTHIVRPEEWPIMTPHVVKFTLMPNGFFSSNPVVRMPKLKTTPKPIASAAAKNLSGGIAYDKSVQCATPVKGVN
ncbi:MAG: hypothetical protein M3Q05_01545 [Bacteroidota bacterium]|nr:hypothetical protein [Bacteroidota bacterium]